MKYYSELTKKVYDSPEEVNAAEAEIKAEEERKLQLKEKRTERAKEIEDAYKVLVDAQKRYNELVNQFVKDYGSFHMTYNGEKPIVDLWENLFRLF